VGEPRRVTDAQGRWHVHMGGWSPDGKEIVYSHCAPQGDLLVIENYH
jgi:Tol biopolymer transport system component